MGRVEKRGPGGVGAGSSLQQLCCGVCAAREEILTAMLVHRAKCREGRVSRGAG